ncbi:MAG: hypothetical protein ACKOTZ_04175 [Chloroflexota bacterium]
MDQPGSRVVVIARAAVRTTAPDAAGAVAERLAADVRALGAGPTTSAAHAPSAGAATGDRTVAHALVAALAVRRDRRVGADAPDGPWIVVGTEGDATFGIACTAAGMARARALPVLASIVGASAGRSGDPERAASPGTPARLRAAARAVRLALADGRLRSQDVAVLLADGPVVADAAARGALARIALGPHGAAVPTPPAGIDGSFASALALCAERRPPLDALVVAVATGRADAAVVLRGPADR